MSNPSNQTSPNPATESVLATYGTILAVVLAVASIVVGFSKTNIFVALAFLPMIGYFLYESTRKFSKVQFSSISAFFLQDNALLRVSLSLLVVAIIASVAKANVAPAPTSQVGVNQDIVSPLQTR